MYGVIGLGRMGAGLVRRLMDQGQAVAVYDADPHNVEELALAAPGEYAYVGSSGSGHYVKMVHNAIEYGMLEAIGEGFELLSAGVYPELELARIANLWSHGSVIRGWLMELLARHLAQDPAGVPFPAIALSYAMRLRSRQSDTFAGKVVAALRWEFGRHPVTPAQTAGKRGED